MESASKQTKANESKTESREVGALLDLYTVRVNDRVAVFPEVEM